jgi:hypothetical protein
VPPAALAAELGSLPRDPAKGIDPLWVTAGGYLVTEAVAGPARRSVLGTVRWALAPLGWRDGDRPLAPRARAALRRVRTLARRGERRSMTPVAVVAHVHRHAQPGRLALHSAFHPVTGDQLLATNRWEAIDMGYGAGTIIGYLDALAPVTGSLDAERPAVPWATRFGQRIRNA